MQQSIILTVSAKEKLLEILVVANKNNIRLGLKSLGCTGYEHVLHIDDTSLLCEDIEVEISTGKFLLVDPLSFKKLAGTTIDYVKELLSEKFVFTNPSIRETCGCGKSVLF